MAKQWMGTPPSNCDHCQKEIKFEFYDAMSKFGPWGIFCPDCWKEVGRMGQHYRQYQDGVWYKERDVRRTV